MHDKICVSVIGLGIMGRRMLTALDSHETFFAGHIWDPDAQAVAKASAIAPNAIVSESPEIAIEAADVVYLACPPEPRRLYAMMGADCGKPLFLEKPLGISLPASRSLVHHIEQAQVPAAVNFTQATDTPLETITAALTSGEMGEFLGIDIHVSYPQWPRAWQVDADWLRFRAEGGMTREVISHFVFFAERLMGTTHLNWAHPDFPDDELCETHMAARLSNHDGLPLNIFAAVGGQQPNLQEVFVKGSKKSFKVQQFSELWVSEGEDFTLIADPGENARIDGLHAQLDALGACMRGEQNKLATIQEALSVQEKIEGMLAS
ncbi:Gfo/Idh/MocA family protein [Maritalea sp.]|uniref:Gfo/Idh/MocA family protein n=1 Tax=Maritalea sp. TaxID=2003361 RepID=UPI003EF7EDD1